MSCLARLALVFVVLPLVELALLIRIGQVVGVWPTLALVVVTGMTGAALARAEGLKVYFQFQRELAARRIPGQAALDGISVLLGGVLLLTPGVLTDRAGIALLLPPTRRWIQRRARARLEEGIRSGALHVVMLDPSGFGSPGGGTGEPGTAEPGLDPRNEITIDPPEA